LRREELARLEVLVVFVDFGARGEKGTGAALEVVMDLGLEAAVVREVHSPSRFQPVTQERTVSARFTGQLGVRPLITTLS